MSYTIAQELILRYCYCVTVCKQIGLDKIVSTKAQVGGLQAQLTEMEPVLIRTQADVEALIVQVRTTAVACYAPVVAVYTVKRSTTSSVVLRACACL
jgi:hypothetical protein